MTTFRVRHRTSYSYDRPVEFGLHQLMVRPRDGHDMRLLASSLAVTPRADVRWAFDTFGVDQHPPVRDGNEGADVLRELLFGQKRIPKRCPPPGRAHDLNEFVLCDSIPGLAA